MQYSQALFSGVLGPKEDNDANVAFLLKYEILNHTAKGRQNDMDWKLVI